jgi:class 3 adenylate cyclase/tetratricopeptide (TPR) repeat protein
VPTTTAHESDTDCRSCGRSNPPGARFCGACGAPLAESVACPNCSALNPTGQRFCNACGAALTSPETGPDPLGLTPDPLRLTPDHLAEKIRASRGAVEGERKQVTVLFADVSNSMELAERSDAEQWRRVMNDFFALLCEGIHRYEGTVDKFTGDGLMALFGAPIAHEDHAQRACYAALHLQDRLAAHAAELRRSEGINVSVRIGINSGEVVVGAIGEDLDMDYTAIGHTVGLAQRMESLAEPGKAYLTAEAASLVEGYLAVSDLGEFRVKGVSDPVRVYELVGMGEARGRLDVSRARGLSRFVGREEEMRLLENALEDAKDGEAAVIGIVGEAGIGKSRLCQEFADRCRGREIPVYHALAQAHTKSVPLLPVLRLLRSYFGIAEEDSDHTARERIAGKLLLLDDGFADDLPLIFELLSVPDHERPAPRMDPEARQRRLLDVIGRLIRAQSAREPGVNLFEDLHWIDSASEAFLASHIEAVRGTRSLTIVNFRPEYHATWMSRSYYRQIALVPLRGEATQELLAEMLGSHPSLNELQEFIPERTGGNPFFIEEVVQSLIESGNLEGEPGAYELVRPVDDAAVPASVRALLAARIDRLDEREKGVLQAAAVIGKEFSEPVLARVVELEPAELSEALRRLVAAEFVFEQEVYPNSVYAFKHPLTQEVAYGSQLGERLAATHAATARAIVESHPERLDEWAALLAGHWQAAGDNLEAARWHARAAAWTGTHQPTESLEHWQQVRELTDSLPGSAESDALGLMSRIFLLQFGWRLGITSEEAEALFTEADQLASRAGDVHSRAIVLASYGGIRAISHGDLRGGTDLSRRALALAEESGDATLYMTIAPASYAFFLTGDAKQMAAVLDRAIDLADGDGTMAAGVVVGCPLAYCHAFKGSALIELGRLDEARELIRRGATIAREHDDIETVGWCHMLSVWHSYYSGNPDIMPGHAQQALEIAERIGDSFSRAWSWYLLGVALKERGELAEAVDAIERSQTLSRDRRTAAEVEPMRLAMLGECYQGLGHPERGRGLVESGLELARGRGYPSGEAHACVSLARVLRASRGGSAVAEIEATLDRGLEVVRSVGPRVIEPLLRVELASLAGEVGDEERRQRELREAHRMFIDVGAAGWADRVAADLATLTG